MKQTIKLNESQLRHVIKESIEKVLREQNGESSDLALQQRIYNEKLVDKLYSKTDDELSYYDANIDLGLLDAFEYDSEENCAFLNLNVIVESTDFFEDGDYPFVKRDKNEVFKELSNLLIEIGWKTDGNGFFSYDICNKNIDTAYNREKQIQRRQIQNYKDNIFDGKSKRKVNKRDTGVIRNNSVQHGFEKNYFEDEDGLTDDKLYGNKSWQNLIRRY